MIRRVGELGSVAEELDEMSLSDRAAAVDNVLYFLRNVLLPEVPQHSPAIEEHARALADADPADSAAMRRHLYALEALIENSFPPKS